MTEIRRFIAFLFSNFTWTSKEEKILEKYTDISLMQFLAHREIPLWASIVANALRRPIQDHEIEYLNNTSLPLGGIHSHYLNPMVSAALDIFVDIIHHLVLEEVLSQCQYCLRFIRFRKGKKYCSKAVEGRDCGRRTRNKNYYYKNKDKLCRYYRKEMKKTRAYYKDLSKKFKK